MVLAYSDGISPVPPYSFLTVYTLRVRDYHPLWSHFPISFHSSIYSFWAPPFSLATTHRITIVLFSSGYLDVSVLRVGSHCWVLYLQYNRLSHSEIFGLSLVCSYPKLIAAYHVLHRLLVPRHPPYALIRFKYCIIVTQSGDWATNLLFTLLLIHYSINTAEIKIAFPICQRSLTPLPSQLRCSDVYGFEPIFPPLR